MAKAVFNEWPPSRMGQAGADLIALGEKASLEFDANGLRRYVAIAKRAAAAAAAANPVPDAPAARSASATPAPSKA
jgi:hypothetical protein